MTGNFEFNSNSASPIHGDYFLSMSGASFSTEFSGIGEFLLFYRKKATPGLLIAEERLTINSQTTQGIMGLE